MSHVSRTHRLALDWLCDRINLDTKIQIKYIDTKNQLADILTKGNFTGNEWNHLLNLFNISHFSPTVCSAAMAKRFQQDSGEERVTAKSKPMMNLIARMPSVASSSTSVSQGKRYYGKQDPWKFVVADDRSGQPDRLSSTDYSKKLLDNHEKKLLDSYEEKFLDKQNSSNQPNQSKNQSVIDQGILITNTKCLLMKAKHPGLERSRRNLFTKNSVLQIDQGNLITTSLSGEI